ncbi:MULTISPECIES: SusC/RagA family TonB-linked outer membrane protein [Pedobacter]|uniref:SusC/RagA family TonB-linked outer membrane protein n=1 Tax=Pedobacter TaxID=84567 RepID=UPI0006496F74|nr:MULTISPECIES: TonB-dependent receptor [Pedobacter]KLT65888.1 membrane protein [Pedobacter sp. BMA]
MKRIFTRISVLAALCLLTINVAIAQNITVKGKVTDGGDKSSLPGVTITIKGAQGGTQTDADGNYSISVPSTATLVFNFVGYTAQEQAVANRTSINVALLSSTQQLEQVVVVGYGTQRKIDVTGSVASVKGEEISKQASTNPVSALQGKVAGVTITNAGSPGSSPQIKIRGQGTIYGSANPLYVVDGVWYDDINFLNPGDIENISILKDASAQSIFGIRAANGVVLVTTKKGRTNTPTTINYDGYVGFQKVTNQVEMANASEYATIINELYTSNGNAALFSNTNLGEGTNWYDQALRNALVTNHQVSIMGGSEKSNYNLSLGYLNQDGIIKTNNYKRYTARLSNDIQIFKPLKVGYTVTGVMGNTKDNPSSIYHQLFAASPTVPVFNADGSYGDPKSQNLGDGANFNPQATLDFFNSQSKNNRVTGNVYAELKFAKHFTFKTSLGGEFGQIETRAYVPKYYATLAQQSNISTLTLGRTETRNWLIENTLTYNNTIAKDHNLTVLVGQSAQQNKSYNLTGTAQNVPFNTEADLYLTLGDLASRTIVDGGSLYKFASYFTRANYSFKNKYLLNASVRADGASQFFGSDTWGYFPSVGLGWVVTEEGFMKDQKIFNSLKIRGSWGKIGNAAVPRNPTQLNITQTPDLTAVFGNDLTYTGANVFSYVPPTISWERGVGTNIGFEASLLKSRLSIEADYYLRKTSQSIFNLPILGSLGSKDPQILGNQADLENKGFEFSATWRDRSEGGFGYSLSGNVAYNANKVTNVVSGANPIYAGSTGITNGYLATRTVAGQPVGQFYGYQVVGIFQTAAEIASSPTQSNAAPGGFKYQDVNGDGIINANDKVVLGNPNPRFTYGFNTSFEYKNFDLALDFQGVAGVEVYNANIAFRYGNENFTKDFYDNRWHGAGTSNTYPSANVGGSANSAPNSFFVESGSYFRIRNAQLGYTLPKAITEKLKMQKVRFYANAQNALNIFGYKGFSPEIVASTTQNSPSSLNAGIDANVYPLFATYNFGINVTF